MTIRFKELKLDLIPFLYVVFEIFEMNFILRNLQLLFIPPLGDLLYEFSFFSKISFPFLNPLQIG